MKYVKLYIALFLLALLSALLLYSAYDEVRLKTIDQLNNQQFLLAREAAKGIEGFFNHYARLLNALARIDSIADLDEHGKELMEIFYQSHAGEIATITRMDADGRIVHALPLEPNVIGVDLSSKEHVRNFLKNHEPVVSDVIMTAHGFESIAFHVPVFKNQTFDGSVSILIPFDHIAKKYLEGIKLAEDGYAWMISRKGVELYCPVPGHVGKSVYENCKDFPEILSMADQMVQGREGVTTYVFDKVRGETVESVKKHAVYLPVRLPDNYWSIVVATPESEVLGILYGFRNRWLLLAGTLLLAGVLCSYYLGRAFLIAKEEAKRAKISKALHESETQYRRLVELAREGIWAIDAEGNTTLVNPRMAELLGHTREEMKERRFDTFMPRQGVDIFKACMEPGSEGAREEDDVEFVRKDGIRVHARVAACPIMSDGNCIGALAVVTDMTAQKRIEEQLRESEQRWHFALEGAGDGVWDWNAQTNKVFFSRQWKAMLGYEDHEIGDTLDEWERRIHPEDRVQVHSDIYNHFNGYSPVYVNEHRLMCKDGAWKWILDRGKVISRTSEGKPLRVIGTHTDITGRKQAEQAIRESEVKYRTLFESATSAAFLIRDDKFIDCNDAAVRMYGLSREEIIGRTPFDCSPPFQPDGEHSREAAVKRITDVLAGIPQSFEWVHSRPDGSCFDAEVVLNRLELGDEMLVLGIVRDVTSRKQAEKALRESAWFQQQLIDALPVPVFYKDTDGRYLGCNKAFETFINMSKDEIIGKAVFEIAPRELAEAYHEKDCALFRDNLVQVYESSITDADGSPHAVIFHKATFSRADGSVGGLIGAVLDITERKRAEEKLKDNEQHLQSIIQGYPIPAFVIGKDHKVIYWNKALEEISRIKANGMVRTNRHWMAFYSEARPCMADLLVDETPEEISNWYSGIYNKSSFIEGVYEGTDFFPDIGSAGRWLHFTAAPIRDSQGVIVGAIETLEDVTERKRGEEALVSANRQLNDIIEFLPDATVVMDIEGKVIAWNRAMEEMTGVSKKEMVGQGDHAGTIPFYGHRRPHLVDLIDVRDEDLEARYGHVTRKGGILYAETYVPRLHGGAGAYVFATAAPLLDAHGNRVGAIESIRDITENKLAEEALKESRQQLSDIIDFLPDATLVIDREGKVIAWNRAIEEMTGIRAEDMLGKGDFEYALPFYGERRPILIDLIFNPHLEVDQDYVWVEKTDTVIAGEAYMPMLGRGEIYLYGKAGPLFDSKGNVVGAIESIRDISDRKSMEKAVAEAEAKYRGIFENAVMGIFQTSIDGRFLSLNPALARILGFDSTEEVMNTITDIPRQLYVNPERRSELLRLVEEQGVAQEFEVQFFRKDGSVAWITLNISAVRDSDGKIVRLEGIAQDITNSKLLASRLNQAQKMEAIGTLAGGIAHDFNNILAPIIGYSELSLDAVSKDSRLYHNLQQIHLSGNRARDLVKQILTFSRKTEPERKPVQVSLLIKETLKLLRSSLPSTIEIRQDLDEDAIESTAMADPIQIHQVLMNLCTNAGHAMRENGGVLSISLKNVDIDSVTIRELPDLVPGPYLKLTVADTGHGIDDALRQRIFEPYFTTKGPSEGTGLGLALVYGIIKSLSGGIAVFSEPGQGTTFDVYFPRVKTMHVSAARTTVPLPTGKGHILVVDDEKSIVDMLKEMLESLGYDVSERYSSHDALQAFRARPGNFDLVITDLTMPHMTGIDLAREILKTRSDTPIILCTGFSEAIYGDRTKLLGINGFLMKPVALRDLALTVNRILGQGKRMS